MSAGRLFHDVGALLVAYTHVNSHSAECTVVSLIILSPKAVVLPVIYCSKHYEFHYVSPGYESFQMTDKLLEYLFA